MKITLTIYTDQNTELYLHQNQDKLKAELLNTIKQFVGNLTFKCNY